MQVSNIALHFFQSKYVLRANVIHRLQGYTCMVVQCISSVLSCCDSASEGSGID